MCDYLENSIPLFAYQIKNYNSTGFRSIKYDKNVFVLSPSYHAQLKLK